MTLAIQQFLQQGREQLAEHVAYVQNRIVELSTFGKQLMEQNQAQEAAIEKVAEAVNALGRTGTTCRFSQWQFNMLTMTTACRRWLDWFVPYSTTISSRN